MAENKNKVNIRGKMNLSTRNRNKEGERYKKDKKQNSAAKRIESRDIDKSSGIEQI